MRKKERINYLERELEYKDILIKDKDKKIEILQFIVDNGKHPVLIENTGIKECNGEKYQIKFISTFGDIAYIDIDYFDKPVFKIKSNNNVQCVLSVSDNEIERWYKLFKDRKIIVEIPKPLQWAT